MEVGSVCPIPRMNTWEEELLPASGACLFEQVPDFPAHQHGIGGGKGLLNRKA